MLYIGLYQPLEKQSQYRKGVSYLHSDSIWMVRHRGNSIGPELKLGCQGRATSQDHFHGVVVVLLRECGRCQCCLARRPNARHGDECQSICKHRTLVAA
jgi:hypothetical protein